MLGFSTDFGSNQKRRFGHPMSRCFFIPRVVEPTPEVWCQAVRKDFNPPTILEILDAQSLEVCDCVCVFFFDFSQCCSNLFCFFGVEGECGKGGWMFR